MTLLDRAARLEQRPLSIPVLGGIALEQGCGLPHAEVAVP